MSAQRVETDPRISRRRQTIARSRRRRAIVRLLILLSIAGVAWIALWSPLFRVRHVRILGAAHTTSSEVTRVAGLTQSDGLLLLSTADVAQRVERLPWVERARVDRKLPDTVRVRLTERTAAMIVSAGAARWTVDAHGVVLQSGPAREPLPVLAAPDATAIQVGHKISADEVVSGLAAYHALPRRLRHDVVAVFAPTTERVSLSLASGTSIRFGSAEHLRAKAEVLRALLRRIEDEGSAPMYVDVRVPASPAVSSALAP
jgi:cell division protein FtsQ